MDSTLLVNRATSLSPVVKETYERIKSIVKNNIDRTELLFTEKDLENNIIDEIRKISNWAYDDLFKNPNTEHSDITSRYVHLDLLLEPRRKHTNISQLERKRPLKEIILANTSNTVILGQAGSGKTTSVKYIVNSIFRDPEFLNNIYTLPIVIRLRELNKSNSVFNEFQEGGIIEKLSLMFGLKINIKYKTEKDKDGKENIVGKKEDDDKLRTFLKTKIIPYILDNQKMLLILDGFNEIIDENIKDLVISEIKELTRSLKSVNFILTSRSADYKLLLENTTVYEISELNETQIKEFSNKWFQNSNLSEKFLTELYAKTPYKDFYTRPLFLTQWSLIYSRTNEIPDKPKIIYQRIIELVLKDWNEQQGIKRKTKFSTFTVERKREFLSNMAFNLTIKHNSRIFSKYELSLVYKEINNKFKELPVGELEDVIEEIETYNGLILKSGYDKFEFSHLTLQEYLVADYIVRAGNIHRVNYSDLLKIPNELAIAVALSSEPYIFLYELLVNIMFEENSDIDEYFLAQFFSRIKLEKPDFEIRSDTIQVITLLSIYSKIGKGYASFHSKHIANLFLLEKIIVSLFGNNLVRFLDNYYIKDYTPSLRCGRCFFVFRKSNLANRIISDVNFPENLYWTTSIVEEIQS
jgi:hypothetical protein